MLGVECTEMGLINGNMCRDGKNIKRSVPEKHARRDTCKKIPRGLMPSERFSGGTAVVSMIPTTEPPTEAPAPEQRSLSKDGTRADSAKDF